MFNYMGVIFRLVSTSGSLILLNVIFIILSKLSKRKINKKDVIFWVCNLLFSIYIGLECLFSIHFKPIDTYVGKYIQSNSDSIYFFTDEYTFWNGKDSKKSYYLDLFSKKEVIPFELEEGKTYKVYYERVNNIIVKVEEIE